SAAVLAAAAHGRGRGRPARIIGADDDRCCGRGVAVTQAATLRCERLTDTISDRIVGCLKGIGTGDAVGKQTEMLSRDDVLRWYRNGIRGFEGSPGTIIPRYVGNAKREWQIGETTDDTETTIAVARAILQDGDVRHAGIGRE